MFALFLLRIKKLFFIIFSFNKKFYKAFFLFRSSPSIEHKKIFDLYIRNSDLLLDVGSNIGQFSLLYNLYFPNSDIFSFEPNEFTYKIYKIIFQNNDNIKLFPIGLSNKKKIQKLNITRAHDNSSFYQPLSKNKKYKIIRTQIVQTNLFDNLNLNLQSYKKILLKIDVQGFELNVLKGFAKSLKFIHYIIIEVSFVELYDNQDLVISIKKFLEKNNFKLIEEYNVCNFNNHKIQSDLIYEKK